VACCLRRVPCCLHEVSTHSLQLHHCFLSVMCSEASPAACLLYLLEWMQCPWFVVVLVRLVRLLGCMYACALDHLSQAACKPLDCWRAVPDSNCSLGCLKCCDKPV
jgi:hypothetical protein